MRHSPLLAFSVTVALFGSGPAQATAPLCSKLQDFVREQMAEKAEPAPRHWIEMHWNFDRAAIWSKACKHSADQPSDSLCKWLMPNTSSEFGPSVLPLQVLDCVGFKSPRLAHYDWHVLDGEFRHRYLDGTWLQMELASKGLQEGEFAFRLAVETVDRRLDPDDLNPIVTFANGVGDSAK